MNRKLQRLAAFALLVMMVAVAGVASATEPDWGPWEIRPGYEASCTQPGQEIRYDKNSSDFETRAYGPVAHQMTEWVTVTPATWDTAGKRTRRCLTCETRNEEEIIPQVVTIWSEWTVTTPATCKAGGSPGVETRYAQNTTQPAQTRAIPAPQHKYAWVEDPKPTCSDPGTRKGSCTVCGEAATPQTIPNLGGKDQRNGHQWGAWGATTAGDCENEKTRTRECDLCGRKDVEKLGFGKHIVRTTTKNGKTYEWFLREPATMNGPGRAVQTCKLCGKVIKSREIKFEGGRYNIAVTAFGPRASAINSALFGLNDRLIPVDFTKIEEQVFALVTDDGILVGEMRVSVMDDTVSVSYQMNDSQTIVSQAVFYMFPDAQSITAADLSDPTRAMPFGTTLPLNGQTYGVIAARLVVNYNAENSANRAFPDSGIYLDGATNNATILQEMTTNLME